MQAAGVVLYQPDTRLILQLLDALGSCDQILVFVNGPLAVEVEDILTSRPAIEVLRSEANVGLAHGLNAILNQADERGLERVVLFDQDSTPDAQFLSNMARVFDSLDNRSSKVAVVGPRLRPPSGEAFKPIGYDRKEPGFGGLSEQSYLPTSGSVLDVSAWKDIGAFRDDFFIDAIDVEWCHRARRQGFKCLLAGDVELIHRWGTADQGHGFKRFQIARLSDPRAFCYLRNNTYCLRLPHMDVRWKLRQAVRLFAQGALLVLSGGLERRNFSLVSRALRDGWNGRLGPPPQDLFDREDVR